MTPSATNTSVPASETDNTVSPPHLYYPREAYFEKFVPIQADGYQKAKSRGTGRAAIVIDNGSDFSLPWLAPASKALLLTRNQ